MVQATIEMIRTTSPMLNHVELKTWNSWSRSSVSTTPVVSDPSYRSWSFAISFV